MASMDTLNLFSNLPRHAQRAIDDAFDINDSGLRPSKRRKICISSADHRPSQIPLDAIPSALQRLDLPPDDEEVLSVFRNAASGWASSELAPPPSNLEAQSRYIGREDWRAVCAVLLENRPVEWGLRDHPDEDESSSDQYVDDDDDDDDANNSEEGIPSARSEVSEDEYLDGPQTSSRRRKGKSREEPSFDELKAQARHLTQRQRQTCLDTYSLFFPHVSGPELADQRIAIKDIQRVAKLLNEKLKADEMLEMLEMFSTSPDKTMGFEDFSCMMMTAKIA